jgi:hypothetical protein
VNSTYAGQSRCGGRFHDLMLLVCGSMPARIIAAAWKEASIG